MRVKGVFVLKKLGTILLALSIGALLSSCLVEKQKAVNKISRTTDTLRIYLDGDYIDYNVTVIISTNTSATTKHGTLRIKWANPTNAIFDPINGSPIFPDLKETSTLTYDGSALGEDGIVTRYIGQVNTVPADPNQGSIILHAIDDGIPSHYWPYAPDNVTVPNSPVYTPVIFNSPITFAPTPQQRFSLMQCAPGLCALEIYAYENTFSVVGDSREIGTELGIFSNPFEVNFSGGTQPQNNPALSFVGDILDLCGDSTEKVNHYGNMFVMPQIGIIKMNNTCTNITTSETVQYNISARATNIRF